VFGSHYFLGDIAISTPNFHREILINITKSSVAQTYSVSRHPRHFKYEPCFPVFAEIHGWFNDEARM
jgi:hypothetical protein